MRISDWSSDVCSSDLLTAMDPATIQGVIRRLTDRKLIAHRPDRHDKRRRCPSLTSTGRDLVGRLLANGPKVTQARSDERRVGKECGRKCRSRRSPYH